MSIIDCHVHIVGNGSAGSGCWFRLTKFFHRFLAWNMLREMALPMAALRGDLDNLYVERLLEFVKSSSLSAVVILAHEDVYDEDGNKIEGFGSFFVPNNYILSLAKSHPQFLAGVSIHPARRDALDELELCIEGGAVLMKCLPNCQNINCSDKRYEKFWKRMAEAKLPLLAHTGGELSVPVYNKNFADPRILTLPLECGVKVIAAHIGSSSHYIDTSYVGVLSQMMERYPNLYADNSALCSPFRSAHISAALRPPIVDRIVHGSDFPIPVSALWPRLRGLIDHEAFQKCSRLSNPLERDYQLKQAMGFSEESFTRINKLIAERSQQIP